MSSEETEAASPPLGVTPALGRRDSGHLAGSPSARWSGTEPAISRMSEVGRGCGQTKGRWGVRAPALKPHLVWEGPWKKAKASNRTMGNPAVRHYRGAAGNVSHGGIVNPVCNRKSRNGNPSPKARRACALSQQHRSVPHEPDTERGTSVPGIERCAASSKREEAGTIHRFAPPSHCRSAPRQLLRFEATSCSRSGWGDLEGVRDRTGGQDCRPPQPSPPWSVSGTTVTASLYSEGRRTTTSVGCRGTRGQNCSTGRGDHTQ